MFKDFVNDITDLVANTIGGLLITIAVAVFLYSIVRFLMQRAKGDADGMKDAGNRIGWSVVVLFIIFSIWGIIALLQGAFFEDFNFDENEIKAPTATQPV